MGSTLNASCGRASKWGLNLMLLVGGGCFQMGSTLNGGVGEAQKIFFNSC